jgi:hypothetical protein
MQKKDSLFNSILPIHFEESMNVKSSRVRVRVRVEAYALEI